MFDKSKMMILVTGTTIEPYDSNWKECNNTWIPELRNLGYKTYNNIIDESYDTVDNDSVRLSMIANEVKRLCNLDTDQLKQFVTDSKIIADYNFECIKSKSNFIK